VTRAVGDGPLSRLTVHVDGTRFLVEVEETPDGRVRVQVDGQSVDVDARLPRYGAGSVLLDGASYLVEFGEDGNDRTLAVDGEVFHVQLEPVGRRRPADGAGTQDGGAQRLVAPMPGKVVAVLVQVGQAVEPGAGLVVLEAMKMENEFRAKAAGVVAEVHVTPGQAVNAGDTLLVIA
jgi:biotin carboxyl carrier protein